MAAGAGEVELDGQKFPVRETPRKCLREVDFVFEGQPPRKTVLETRKQKLEMGKQKEVGPGLALRKGRAPDKGRDKFRAPVHKPSG
jgi:hypothetical protein